MRRPGRAVVPAVVLALAACSGGDAEPPAPTGVLRPTACTDGPNWAVAGPEPDRAKTLEVRCAVLRVPRDPADAGRGTLALAVARVRSTRQHDRIGSLVLNPGGPGASGLDALPGWAAWFPDDLLERFDLVTFDPRGAGASNPVDCRDPETVEPVRDVLDPAAFTDRQEEATARAHRCGAATAGTPYGTDAVAHDIDVLRAALGEEQLSYVGWSYGARLGAHYGHLFPDRVRALVLDSPPHPTAAWPDVVAAKVTAFEATLTAYDAGCPARDTCAHLAGTPREVLTRVVATARRTPIRSGRPALDPPATWDVVVRAVLGYLPAPEAWTYLDDALAEADRGDSGSLYDLVDALRGGTPAHPERDADDVQQVVLCTDTARGPAAAELTTGAADLVRRSPQLGPYLAWELVACTPWSAPRRPLPVPGPVPAPVLVVGGTADPSTPVAGAQALADLLGPQTTLLRSERPGHTAFGRSACVDESVTAFLIDPERPVRSRCPA